MKIITNADLVQALAATITETLLDLDCPMTVTDLVAYCAPFGIRPSQVAARAEATDRTLTGFSSQTETHPTA